MLNTIDGVLGLSLKSEQLGFSHMAARAALMDVALIVLVRVAKSVSWAAQLLSITSLLF
jgi:hypothetical protein